MNKAKKEHGYAAVTSDNGANYREIAERMTALGHPMRHASAHNYVIACMRKFADAFTREFGKQDRHLTFEELDVIAKDPRFQTAIIEIMHYIANKEKENKRQIKKT